VADGLEGKITIEEARYALRDLTCRADKLDQLPRERDMFIPLFEDLTDKWGMA
jgi:hypothetical protein